MKVYTLHRPEPDVTMLEVVAKTHFDQVVRERDHWMLHCADLKETLERLKLPKKEEIDPMQLAFEAV